MAESSAVDMTMRILEQSKNGTAQAVLMHALTVDNPQIRDTAARALLRSGTAIAKTEVIRNIHRFGPDLIAELSTQEKLLSFPLQQCLQHGDQESSLKALETIEAAQMYQEIPILLKFLKASTHASADRAEQTLLILIDHLYNDRLRLKSTDITSVSIYCEQLTEQLGTELLQFEKLRRPRALLEAVLILTDPQHAVAQQLIRESSTDCQSVIWDILAQSCHPGIFLFLINSLNLKYVHPRILEIISRRKDIEFQLCLVRVFPQTLTVNQERNYCQLQGLPWLHPSEELWQRFPPSWQGQLVRLIDALAYKHDQKVAFFESALLYGSVDAKNVAVKHRTLIRQPFLEKIVLQSLESPEEDIEAWAVSELQNTDLPEKYRYLVNRLDSPSELIQQQAREALGRFDVPSAILFCETARPSIGPKLAELLLKINPNALLDLSRELSHPVRTRRLRAAKAAAFMNLQNDVAEALLEMLFDSDAIVRRMVAEILGTVPRPSVISALKMLLEDSSLRVREAAAASLNNLEQLTEAAG